MLTVVECDGTWCKNNDDGYCSLSGIVIWSGECMSSDEQDEEEGGPK